MTRNSILIAAVTFAFAMSASADDSANKPFNPESSSVAPEVQKNKKHKMGKKGMKAMKRHKRKAAKDQMENSVPHDAPAAEAPPAGGAAQ